jgi:hypothetical protein
VPKSLSERLAHGEDLARIFEDYEPRDEDRRDSAPHNALIKAVGDRAAAERDISDAVAAMRAANWAWSHIGGILGTSGQAAQQRYGSRASN